MKPAFTFIKLVAPVLGIGAITTAVQAQPDYPPAIWRPVYSGHWYTSGNGHKFVVIHDMEGYYLSTISYFQQSGTQVSIHYMVNGLKDNASDAPAGEISQGVREAYYAWHALCWNTHSAGTEHEGFASNPAWYTEAMYQASAGLQRHLCDGYGIAKDRNHIVAHGQKSVPGWSAWAGPNLGIDPNCNSHTDPGPNWDWNHFMVLINPPPPSLVPSAGQRIKGDFNGDGREDVVIAYDYGNSSTALWVFTSAGTTFNTPAVWWSTGQGNWDATRSQWVAGDFNGDGKTDVACLYDYGNSSSALWVFLSTGSGFSAPATWWSTGPGNWDAQRSKIVAGDFNNDGKTDIAVAYNYGAGNTSLWTFLSSGVGFNAPGVWWSSGAGNWEWPRSQWVSGDFNGDGKTDVAALYDYGNSSSALFVFPSTGSSFSGSSTWWSTGPGNWDATRSKLVTGSFNGDNKTDIAIAYNYGGSSTALWMFISSGSTFNAPATWWSTGSGWEWPRSQWVAGDFTGDGKSDIAAFYNYGSSHSALFVFPSTGTAFSGTALWYDNNGGWDWTRSTAF
jgi:N-acetylmuramoyl-L-alanine amidase/FG-GAP-like repeat